MSSDHTKQLREIADSNSDLYEDERNNMRAAADELERLRTAMEKIAEREFDLISRDIARAALEGK